MCEVKPMTEHNLARRDLTDPSYTVLKARL